MAGEFGSLFPWVGEDNDQVAAQAAAEAAAARGRRGYASLRPADLPAPASTWGSLATKAGNVAAALPGEVKRIVSLPAALWGSLNHQGGADGMISDSDIDPARLSADLAMNLAGGGSLTAAAPAGSVGIFGGRLAKTADLKKLEEARAMQKAGAYPDEIHSATGWHMGPDGNWRFEIDDSASTMNPGRGHATAGSAISHPELFAAYPDLADTKMLWGSPPDSGFYQPPPYKGGPDKISLSTSGNKQRGVMLHELQHAVQEREGFAKGGNPNEFTDQAGAETARGALTLRRELAKTPADLPPSQRIAAVKKQYDDLGAPDWWHSQQVIDRALDPQFSNDRLQRIVETYGLDKRVTPYTGREIYRHLAGEVESNNVMNRMDWDAQKRRDIPPSFSQDVPDKDQLVRFGNMAGSLHQPPQAPSDLLTIYRGESVHNRGGNFYSPDAEWARQFTQSGLEKEVLQRQIPASAVHEPSRPVYAGDPDAVDAAIAEARKAGKSAVRLSEGAGEPPSLFVFDKKLLKRGPLSGKTFGANSGMVPLGFNMGGDQQ